MSRIRVGISALGALLVLVAVWAVFRPHGGSVILGSKSLPDRNGASSSQIAKPLARPSVQSKVASLWSRPSPEVASRNRRRSGFAWTLRLLGATESQLNRLVGGDASTVVMDLKQKARAGDAAAIQILGELAIRNCRLGRSPGFLDTLSGRQIAEAQALPSADREWFSSTRMKFFLG
jgi:hypothetical protein